MVTPRDAVIRMKTRLDPGRFDPVPGRPLMAAVVTTGRGGAERLDYREVPVPRPGGGEVLLRVLAAGVNPTDVNTRLGWYSAGVVEGTGGAAKAAAEAAVREDGGWSAPTPFPLIQGTDCCGRVVDVGRGADRALLGRRALVRPCMRTRGSASMDTVWMGSDFDGAFAQFVSVPASEVFPVECDLSDAELGAVPCAYGTAANMLLRAAVAAGDHVVVAGASGGVGSAAVQLAAAAGARVTALAGADGADAVLHLGADRVVGRDADVVAEIGERAVDVVVDNVSGPGLGVLLQCLRRGGRYVTSGAIAGPLVTIDKRTLYLNDLTLFGCTAWDEPVFAGLIADLERGVVRPLLAGTYPLAGIAEAQTALLERRGAGKLVLLPPD